MIQGIKSPRAGIVAIDLHRGHLDPAVATMPLDARTLPRAWSPPTSASSTGARAAGIPVVPSASRPTATPTKSALNPFWRIAAKTRTTRARTSCSTTSSACRAAR